MSVIDDLLKDVSAPQKTVLQHIRKLILERAPEAKEVMTYGMPGFKYKNKYLVSFAAFKDHMSIFPGAEAVETYAPHLKGYTMSKGTIQFTVEKPISDEILVGIIENGISRINRG
jgi:uncharacterized protein YdhG (YjbR/CyaY superfamily)